MRFIIVAIGLTAVIQTQSIAQTQLGLPLRFASTSAPGQLIFTAAQNHDPVATEEISEPIPMPAPQQIWQDQAPQPSQQSDLIHDAAPIVEPEPVEQLNPAPAQLCAPIAEPAQAEQAAATPTHIDLHRIIAEEPSASCGDEACECESCEPGHVRYPKYCTLCAGDPATRGPLVIREDPLPSASFESFYKTPDCCRGLWATYPEEKSRECKARQHGLNPPPPCRDCVDGPVMYYPAGHPLSPGPGCTTCR